MIPTETITLRRMAARGAAWWTRFLKPEHIVDAATTFHRADIATPSAVSVAALQNAGALARTHLGMNPKFADDFERALASSILQGRMHFHYLDGKGMVSVCRSRAPAAHALRQPAGPGSRRAAGRAAGSP